MNITLYKFSFLTFLTIAIGSVSFTVGFILAANGLIPSADARTSKKKKKRVVYPKRTRLDFEGIQIDGELKSPGEFYFLIIMWLSRSNTNNQGHSNFQLPIVESGFCLKNSRPCQKWKVHHA